jgi:hypothetical protein
VRCEYLGVRRQGLEPRSRGLRVRCNKCSILLVYDEEYRTLLVHAPPRATECRTVPGADGRYRGRRANTEQTWSQPILGSAHPRNAVSAGPMAQRSPRMRVRSVIAAGDVHHGLVSSAATGTARRAWPVCKILMLERRLSAAWPQARGGPVDLWWAWDVPGVDLAVVRAVPAAGDANLAAARLCGHRDPRWRLRGRHTGHHRVSGCSGRCAASLVPAESVLIGHGSQAWQFGAHIVPFCARSGS